MKISAAEHAQPLSSANWKANTPQRIIPMRRWSATRGIYRSGGSTQGASAVTAWPNDRRQVRQAARPAEGRRAAYFEILNRVVLNQLLVLEGDE